MKWTILLQKKNVDYYFVYVFLASPNAKSS